MRFFSNEARDDTDEQKDTGTAVPQQRTGSPWQQPSTVAGTAPGRADDDPGGTTPPTGTIRGVTFEDGTHRAETVQVDPAPSGSSAPTPSTDKGADGLALEDRGTADDPHATQPIRIGTDKDGDGIPDRDASASGSAAAQDKIEEKVDRYEADSHQSDLHQHDLDQNDLDQNDLDRSDKAADVTEPLVKPALSTGSTISGPAPFFPAGGTQPLRDRWRDVQLRFVDDPKGATSEASNLVDDAVDQLATALREHRSSFAKGTDDTEALRVELRSYRDILDRLLGL